jgi:hypothetical protein
MAGCCLVAFWGVSISDMLLASRAPYCVAFDADDLGDELSAD